MRLFTVSFDCDVLGEPKRIEFSGFEPDQVFALLEKENVTKPAVLWEGDQKLGTVRRTSDDFWELTP